MKKAAAVMLAVFMAVIITGCSGEKEPHEALKDANKNFTETFKNEKVHCKVNLSGSFQNNGMERRGNITTDIKSSPDKKKITADLNIGMMGINVKIFEDDNTAYIKLPNRSKYLKTKLPESTNKGLGSEFNEKLISKIPEENFKSSNATINVDDEKINTRKINVSIGGEKAKDIIGMTLDKFITQDTFNKGLTDAIKANRPGLSPQEVEREKQAAFQEIKNRIENALNKIKIKEMTYTTYIKDDMVKKEEANIVITAEQGPSEDSKINLNMETVILNTGSGVSIEIPDIPENMTTTLQQSRLDL